MSGRLAGKRIVVIGAAAGINAICITIGGGRGAVYHD